MNILFVNNLFNLFANADSGASQRSMRFIRALALVGHVDVVSFVDDTVSNIPNVDVIYSKQIEKAAVENGGKKKLLRLFQTHNPYAIYPPQPDKERVLNDIISTHDYDIIVVRYIHFACDCGLLKYADKLVVDIDDDPKQVMLMSISNLGTIKNKLYHRLYANTIDRVSRNIISSVRGAFYSTPGMNYSNAHFLPNISIFQSPLETPIFENQKPTILMVGWFRYFPNINGLSHFIKNIFPIIKKAIPNVELDVVGNMDDENLHQLCLDTKGVNLKGFVEDLKEQYQKCHCVVVPLYQGTGTSVKLVEAMSLARTVVSTPIGIRGLNPAFVPNQDFYLAENDDEFANHVIYLLTHPIENIKMANSALAKVEKYYSEKMFNQTIASLLKK